jgi:hypothetical protein
VPRKASPSWHKPTTTCLSCFTIRPT